MSMASLERVILANSRIELNNKRLRMKDIMEWSTGEIKPRSMEVVVFVKDPGVFVAVDVSCDKRTSATPAAGQGER